MNLKLVKVALRFVVAVNKVLVTGNRIRTVAARPEAVKVQMAADGSLVAKFSMGNFLVRIELVLQGDTCGDNLLANSTILAVMRSGAGQVQFLGVKAADLMAVVVLLEKEACATGAAVTFILAVGDRLAVIIRAAILRVAGAACWVAAIICDGGLFVATRLIIDPVFACVAGVGSFLLMNHLLAKVVRVVMNAAAHVSVLGTLFEQADTVRCIGKVCMGGGGVDLACSVNAFAHAHRSFTVAAMPLVRGLGVNGKHVVGDL